MKYSLIVLAAVAAVEASPFPQGVTQSIAPSAVAPAGCSPTYAGTFGIAVMNATTTRAAGVAAAVTTSGSALRPVTQISDGQVQGGRTTMAPVNQISDGQVQQQRTTMRPINQISDGQVQNQRPTATPVQQISDGQIQNRPSATPVQQISDGQIQNRPSATPVQQISDGQIQNRPSATPVQQISDGQIQNRPSSATPVRQISDGQIQNRPTTASAVNQISDGQVQQRPTTSAARQISDGQVQQSAAPSSGGSGATSGQSQYVACKSSDTLAITLANGVLKDAQGRTGYIASNYQFQFDGPPQAGAIYTAGFSVCGNGSLALGGTTIFWQCLSGNFYNLYDRKWAAQCSPINIQAVELVNC